MPRALGRRKSRLWMILAVIVVVIIVIVVLIAANVIGF